MESLGAAQKNQVHSVQATGTDGSSLGLESAPFGVSLVPNVSNGHICRAQAEQKGIQWDSG